VDDESLVRDAIECVLLFYFKAAHIVTAVDGAEGLERCHHEPFDLIITDIQMPRLTGIELLAATRQAAIETPAIVLSGSELPDQDLSALGKFTFLPKIDLPLLPAFVRQMLDHGTDTHWPLVA